MAFSRIAGQSDPLRQETHGKTSPAPKAGMTKPAPPPRCASAYSALASTVAAGDDFVLRRPGLT
jgi:hypothetical protein